MRYFVKRFITLIITLFLVSLLAFLAFQVISDPAAAILGTNATPENLAALRQELGLDDPVPVQYFRWLAGFFRGDLGTSYAYRLPVAEMVAQKLPITAGVTVLSFVLMLLFSLPLGILSARWAGGVLDHILTILGQVCMSVPAFLLGVGLSYLFGIVLRVFTPGVLLPFSQSPAGWLVCLFFPAVAIAVPRIAMTVKMLRAAILDQMDQNYVRTAYSRGNTRSGALRRHVLRNALIPVITFIASSMAEIVASCILVEQVFALPGLGVLLLSSIGNRDFPVVQAVVVLLAVWVIVVNFIADLLYQIADPRIRLG